ncbi:MAG: ATP-binding protein [bacterium]
MKLFPQRSSISRKLIFWCLSLILIFYATTAFLYLGIRQTVSLAHSIVAEDYAVVTTTERMIQQLLDVLEHKKRYAILNKPEDQEAYSQGLLSYRTQLVRLDSLSAGQEEWENLLERLDRTVSSIEERPTLISDEEVGRWMSALSTAREFHRGQMAERLNVLLRQSTEAASIGLAGALGALIIGISGTALLAFTTNRSLRELKQGIRQVNRRGEIEPIRVLSRDELGDVAVAFNEMAARLKREERMRGDFIAMLGHEIKEPLRCVNESLSLIGLKAYGTMSAVQTRFVKISQRELDRLAEILNRMMRLSKMESGSLPMNPGPVSVQALLEDAVERIQPSAQSKGVTVDMKLPEREYQILADEDHLRQILLNLLGNAVAKSPSGAEIGLKAGPGEEGKSVIFRVNDKGPVISEEDVEKLFEHYSRTHPGNPWKGSNTDLSISKRIVEVHGGTMWVQGKPGHGNVFSFSIPMIQTTG